MEKVWGHKSESAVFIGMMQLDLRDNLHWELISYALSVIEGVADI